MALLELGTAALAIQTAPAVIELINKAKREKGKDPTFTQFALTVQGAIENSLRHIKTSLEQIRSDLDHDGLDVSKPFDDLLRDKESYVKLWTYPTYWKLENAKRKVDQARRSIDDNLSDVIKLLMCRQRGEDISNALTSELRKTTQKNLDHIRNSNLSVQDETGALVSIINSLLEQLQAA